MSDQIGFNYIPGSGLTAPLMSFEVNSGGQYAATTRLVLMGHATASGTLAANSQAVVSSQAQADALAGPGSMLREMFRVAAANAPAQPIWLMNVAAVGAAAVWSMTIGALPGTAGVATFKVGSELLSVSVAPTDTPVSLAANMTAAINAYYNSLTNAMLPVTATSAPGTTANGVTPGVITATARHAGAIMNDVTFYVPPNVSGNVLSLPGVFALSVVTAGTGTPDLSGALAALGDQPADFIVAPWSDTNSLALYTATTNDVSGRWSWARQSYGHVFTTYSGSFSAATTFGLGLNDRHLTAYRRLPNTATPSWLWAAAMTARVAPWLSDCVTGNVSRNQTGLIVQGISAPWDLSTLDNYSARNTLNNSGMSTFSVAAGGQVQVDKIVTTYRSGPLGQPDTVFRDIQSVYQVAGGLAYLRAVLATSCGQKALANTNPGNLAAICTPSDVKAAFIQGYDQLCLNGVFQGSDQFSQSVTCAINSQNPNRVDVMCPMERVNPLDILASNATIYQQYPAAA